MQLVEVYRARVIDVSPESLVIEATGTEDKIDSLLEVLRPYGVVEMVRTGRVAMARGTGRGCARPAESRAGRTPATTTWAIIRCNSGRPEGLHYTCDSSSADLQVRDMRRF